MKSSYVPFWPERASVFMAPESFDLWLGGQARKSQPPDGLLVAQLPPELLICPIGRAVNNPANDNPRWVEPQVDGA